MPRYVVDSMSGDIPSFSKRIGIEPIEKKIQMKEMDGDLQNSIWNAINDYYINSLPSGLLRYHEIATTFYYNLWRNFFKFPVDEIPEHSINAQKHFKIYFSRLSWNKKYELLEFLSKSSPNKKNEFMNCCNKIFTQESSGYRFVNGILIPIVSPEEIKEVTQSTNTPLDSVNTHMNRALELLSDKQNPDARNSIKESISAVESLCQKIVGKDSATLGDALNVIRDKAQIDLPVPLRDALNKIYGYTSSSQGIRHALSDESKLTVDEARFMLISCSAFINYMILKSSDAKIQLK